MEVGGARASPQAQEGRREPPECPGRLGMRLPVALDLCPCHRPPPPPGLARAQAPQELSASSTRYRRTFRWNWRGKSWMDVDCPLGSC